MKLYPVCVFVQIKFNSHDTNDAYQHLATIASRKIKLFLEAEQNIEIYLTSIDEYYKTAQKELKYIIKESRNDFLNVIILTNETRKILNNKLKNLPYKCDKCIYETHYIITGKCEYIYKENIIKNDKNAQRMQT